MSQYTNYRYETIPEVNSKRLAQAAGVAAMFIGGALTIAGRSLKAMSRVLAERLNQDEQQGIPGLKARLCALENEPLLQAAVLKEFESENPDSMTHRETLLTALHELNSAAKLDGLIERGQRRLLIGQTKLLETDLREILTDMDYALRLPRRTLHDVVSIRGEHENGTAVSVKLTPKHEKLEIDLSGFEGGTCLTALRQIEERLWRRGVRLRLVEGQRHDSVSGGCLTQEKCNSPSAKGPGERRPERKTKKRTLNQPFKLRG